MLYDIYIQTPEAPDLYHCCFIFKKGYSKSS